MIPVAVLQAVRDADKPSAGGDSDLFEQFTGVSKLGQSQTLADQIGRYRALRGKSASVAAPEVLAIVTLCARRADAEWLFAEAGRRAGREAASGVSTWWRLAHRTPAVAIRRSIGRHVAARVARRTFDVDIQSNDRIVWSDVAQLGTDDVHERVCDLYRAATAELLRTYGGFAGALFSMTCRGRGDAECVWSSRPPGV